MKSFSYTMMIVLVAVGMTVGLTAVAQGDTMIWGGYDGTGVNAFDAAGTKLTPPSFTFTSREAQGLALSPDRSILYVSDYNSGGGVNYAKVRARSTATGLAINDSFAVYNDTAVLISGLAVDSGGNLYVARRDGYVDKFTSGGVKTNMWGAKSDATSIADIEVVGNYLYAAVNVGGTGVARYDLSDGTRSMVMTGTRTDGIALGPDGTWYTTDAGTKKVYSWDSSWGSQTLIATLAGESIDVDYFDGALYVACADTAVGIQKYDLDTPGWSTFASGSKYRYTAVMIPEPGTLALLATGLIGLLCYAWRKRK